MMGGLNRNQHIGQTASLPHRYGIAVTVDDPGFSCQQFAVQFQIYVMRNGGQTACRCTTIGIAIGLPLFSLAWARKKTARAADIGIAGLFIVGIAVLVVDHD